MTRLFFTIGILILTISNSSLLHAQACGGGTFTFEIYQLSGEKARDFTYEVLPVTEGCEQKFGGDIYYGLQLDSTQAASIMNPAMEKEMEKHLDYRKNASKGNVKNGILKFATLETAHYPGLLKITSGTTSIYILANLVGGCNRTSPVLWGAYPRLGR